MKESELRLIQQQALETAKKATEIKELEKEELKKTIIALELLIETYDKNPQLFSFSEETLKYINDIKELIHIEKMKSENEKQRINEINQQLSHALDFMNKFNK